MLSVAYPLHVNLSRFIYDIFVFFIVVFKAPISGKGNGEWCINAGDSVAKHATPHHLKGGNDATRHSYKNNEKNQQITTI